MTTGKDWMGGKPGAGKKLAPQHHQEALSTYMELGQDSIAPSALPLAWEDPTQDPTQYSAILMLSIPGKLWASCNLKPGGAERASPFNCSHTAVSRLFPTSELKPSFNSLRLEVKISSLSDLPNPPFPTCKHEALKGRVKILYELNFVIIYSFMNIFVICLLPISWILSLTQFEG